MLAQRAALLRTRLAGRRMLLVLDDAALPDQVQPLFPGESGCAVIVTSRARMPGVATGRSINLAPLDRAEALHLLTRLAGHEGVGAEPEAANAVIEACGRFPLTVRIVAERLAARSSSRVRRGRSPDRPRLQKRPVDGPDHRPGRPHPHHPC